jgi:hypothetical protein
MIHKPERSVKTIPNISLKNVLLLQTRAAGFSAGRIIGSAATVFRRHGRNPSLDQV